MNHSLQLQILHLSLIPNISLSTQKKVYTYAIECNKNVYELMQSDFLACGIPLKTVSMLIDGLKDTRLLKRELAHIERNALSWATLLDSEYPALLFHIHTPPLVLYWKGVPVWNDLPTLAVVGSRKATDYGKRAIHELLIPCIKSGILLVSGGALGIDSLAHQAALNHGGKTVVVLGTGLSCRYPWQNKDLFDAIVFSGGALVTCFPFETQGAAWQFPLRNSIIAGMSRGCFVVQAADKSGSLITADYALKEGRNVYALPGAFDDPMSAGCNRLIAQGASVVLSADDIMQDYGIKIEHTNNQNNQKEEKYELQESLFTKTVLAGVKKVAKKLGLQAKEPVQEVVQEGILRFCNEPISLEKLSELTKKHEDELMQELFMLQLEGKVEQDFAGLWSIKK